MMRAWLLILHLLLLIQIPEAQGIRLRKGVLPDPQNNIQGLIQRGRNNDGVGKAIQGKSNNSSGRNRKLTMTPIRSTTAIAKNEVNKAHLKSEGSSANDIRGRREENLFVNPSSMNEQGQRQRQPAPAPYPGILDLAGMDYSLARRKPPVHN